MHHNLKLIEKRMDYIVIVNGCHSVIMIHSMYHLAYYSFFTCDSFKVYLLLPV